MKKFVDYEYGFSSQSYFSYACKACAAFAGTIVHEGDKYTEETMNVEFRENGVSYDKVE